VRRLAPLIILALLAAQPALAGEAAAWAAADWDGTPVPVRVTVQVEPGNGTLSLEAPRHDELLEESVHLALVRAAIDSGLNPYALDYHVRVEAPGVPALEGPSLALAAYTATLQALGGTPRYKDAVYTGTIGLDGIVGPVGGVTVKARVLDELGAQVLVVSWIQAAQYRVAEDTIIVGAAPITLRRLEAAPLTGLEDRLAMVETGLDAATPPPAEPAVLPAEAPMLDMAATLVARETLLLAREALRLAETTREAPAHILLDARSKARDAQGLLADAATLEELARAYSTAARAYYTLLAYGDPSRAHRILERAVHDLTSAYTPPEKLHPYGAYLAGQAALHEAQAERLLRSALVAVNAYQAGLTPRDTTAQTLGRLAGEASRHAALALLLAAAAPPGPVGPEQARELVDLAFTACSYTVHLSGRTGVASLLVPESCRHAYAAQHSLEDDWALAVYHAVEAIALATTYHALQPGLEGQAERAAEASARHLAASPYWPVLEGTPLAERALDAGVPPEERVLDLARLHALTILSAAAAGDSLGGTVEGDTPPGAPAGGGPPGWGWAGVLVALLGGLGLAYWLLSIPAPSWWRGRGGYLLRGRLRRDNSGGPLAPPGAALYYESCRRGGPRPGVPARP